MHGFCQSGEKSQVQCVVRRGRGGRECPLEVPHRLLEREHVERSLAGFAGIADCLGRVAALRRREEMMRESGALDVVAWSGGFQRRTDRRVQRDASLGGEQRVHRFAHERVRERIALQRAGHLAHDAGVERGSEPIEERVGRLAEHGGQRREIEVAPHDGGDFQ